MKIISIASQKGGCGKTTTAINLAASLSLNGKKTLLIDLDPQAHASLGLNFENLDSIYNVISSLTPRKLAIEEIIKNVDENLDILPSNVLVGTLEQELADEIGRELKLDSCLSSIKGKYEYILIDCPPSLGFLTINAIRASHEVYIPVETSRFSMQGVEQLLDIVNLIRDRLNHPVDYRVAVTMFDSRLRHSFSMMNKLKERFSDVLFDTIIHINVKLKESAVYGKTVAAYDKYCRGAKDYFSLSKEIIANHSLDIVKDQEPAPQMGFSPKMQEMVRGEIKGLTETTFNLEAPNARSVYVTGSFNDWSLEEKCRMHYQNGCWSTTIPLNAGTYRYQFIVDGTWQEDPNNKMQERNSFGAINSLIEIKSDG